MLKQRHRLFVTLLAAVDGGVIASACYAAWGFRLWTLGEPVPASLQAWVREPLAIFIVPIVLVAMWMLGVYRPSRDRTIWPEIGQLAKASTVAVIGVVVMLWAGGSTRLENPGVIGTPRVLGLQLDAERLQLLALAVLLPMFLGMHRVSFRIALRMLRRHGLNLRHVVVVGDERLGQIVCRTLDRNSWAGINVAYFLSHHEHPRRTTAANRPVRGGLSDLERLFDEMKPDAVYLALPNKHAAKIPDVLRRLDKYSLDVRIVPDVHPRYIPQGMSVSELDGMPILSYRECPLYGLGGFSKRMLDVGGALAAFILFAPVMVATAVAVRLSGPGPVIFKQRRVSLGGGEFNIYKFRTMYHVEDEQAGSATWTGREDPRVTPVGALLRRTSLDELPQLFNVLRGEMSLVGPRPERPELIERFREDWRGYMLRQHVKAGMTGWAQVNGHRGDTGLRKRLQYDLFYIRHWSISLDLRILWLTLFRGFMHPNAH